MPLCVCSQCFTLIAAKHRKLIGQLRSYLDKDGLLLITTGHEDWEGEEDFLGVRMSWSHFDAATNKNLIEQNGFTIVLEDVHRGNSVGDEVSCHPIFLARAI